MHYVLYVKVYTNLQTYPYLNSNLGIDVLFPLSLKKGGGIGSICTQQHQPPHIAHLVSLPSSATICRGPPTTTRPRKSSLGTDILSLLIPTVLPHFLKNSVCHFSIDILEIDQLHTYVLL